MSPRVKLTAWIVAVPLALVAAYAGWFTVLWLNGRIEHREYLQFAPVAGSADGRWSHRIAFRYVDYRDSGTMPAPSPEVGNRLLAWSARPGCAVLAWGTRRPPSADDWMWKMFKADILPALGAGSSYDQAMFTDYSPGIGVYALGLFSDHIMAEYHFVPSQGLRLIAKTRYVGQCSLDGIAPGD